MPQQLGLALPPTPDVPETIPFSGPGYEPALDKERLLGHCRLVLEVLQRDSSTWWTYEALAAETGVPPGSVRTRVSNLKQAGHPIEWRTRPDRFREVRLR